MKNALKICLLAISLTAFYGADAQTEVTYYTSMGNFKILLTDTRTPRTVDSFLSRVASKFYDGLIFHRVIDGFMIQGGDPLGTGYGGPGYYTPDEFDTSLKNVAGALAMANSGPNTNGSQFYINLVNNAYLNNHYTVFGMVTSNFTVVQNIGHVPTDANDKPVTNVVIDSIRVTHFPAAVDNISHLAGACIYPNPCRGIFTIDMPATAATIEIMNMQGQVVYCSAAKGRLTVDLRDKPAGLYMVRTSSTNGISESKLIVQ
jgi:cyclophilin family peptidyl-prolyl cis-trans isomerase